jgi:hypothetical protein
MARCRSNVPVQPSDQVSILSTFVSVSGPIGAQSLVVLQPLSPVVGFTPPVFTAYGNDSYGSSGVGQATSIDGQSYASVVGSPVSTPGVVQSIVSGVGSIAILSVLLNSGLVVQVPAGSCNTPNNNGVTQGSV